MKFSGRLPVFIFATVLAILFGGTARAEDQLSLDSYYAGIDKSCETDEDCAVADVGNCCGYYPACANRNADVSRETVDGLCAELGMASVCGYPDIAGCRCDDGVCADVYPEIQMPEEPATQPERQ